MSKDGQGTYCRRNIAENLNRLSRVHERYRRQTDRRQTDGGQQIANVNTRKHWETLRSQRKHSTYVMSLYFMPEHWSLAFFGMMQKVPTRKREGSVIRSIAISFCLGFKNSGSLDGAGPLPHHPEKLAGSMHDYHKCHRLTPRGSGYQPPSRPSPPLSVMCTGLTNVETYSIQMCSSYWSLHWFSAGWIIATAC